MKREKPILPCLLLVLVAQLAFVRDAQAYLDPGTGSLIIQTIIAAFVGTAFTAKLYWRRIKAYLSRDKNAVASTPTPPQEGDTDRG
ncbi:MAG: hypothetical protein DCC71_19815 [Proteobacteria bacterium]|nr:MAG: hypothetical protein DCC71_19815 [Pseudomonadota bacterium]